MASSGSLAGLAMLRRRHCFLLPRFEAHHSPLLMGKIKADLDLHKLEIFYWVAELKSFSQAAELLSLRQPTVSAHVRELEKLVSGKLLYRIRGRVSLTPLGQVLAERAKNLLALDRKSTRLNSSHSQISYAVFCLKEKKYEYYARRPVH